jgi:UDP:flavonoid glycosyltransferase YjiC (YdhE family)
LNSLNEVVESRVPLVCIPLFADQIYNAAMVAVREIGVVVRKDEVSAESLAAALNALLHSDRFIFLICNLYEI